MIRAVVIDDSAFNRVTLTRMLESSGEVEVVGIATDGESGIRQVVRYSPDVVTLDLEMPGIDGFAFLRWLMANKPTPVIAVSSRSDDRSVFKALELGAADFIAKPGGPISPRLEEIRDDLLVKVRSTRQVRLENLSRRAEAVPAAVLARTVTSEALPYDLVVVGASTGGPPALQTLFEKLPRLDVPFVVAQHMPATFTRLFAERVDRLSAFDVREATSGERLRPGTVYVAPGGMQSEIRRSGDELALDVFHPKAEDLYAPSVDKLFASASAACAERLVAVVLTGMGDDGSAAVRGVRARGGRTLAESEESAIIFGMPGEAIRTGAIEKIVPIGRMAAALCELFTRR